MSSNTEEKDLEYTQDIRKQIVTAITLSGDYNKLVNDEDKIDVLLRTLKDIDNVTLNKMKIKSDNDNADKLLQSKSLVAELLSKFDTNTAKYDSAKNNNKRSLDDSDGTRTYVDGELSVGVSDTNYEEFSKNNK